MGQKALKGLTNCI